ncbi:MAG: rRNA maturation RNase YbeY [Pirellulales bacterium]
MNQAASLESTLHILIANQQSTLAIDKGRLCAIVKKILTDANFCSGTLSIAIVDDPTIHQLNRQHLQHDWSTDVLSFPLEQCGSHLEGEVVISADTAINKSAEVKWPATEELLLYAIHGALHLVGYRDKSDQEITIMRTAEKSYLQQAGVEVSALDDRWQGLEPLGGLQAS